MYICVHCEWLCYSVSKKLRTFLLHIRLLSVGRPKLWCSDLCANYVNNAGLVSQPSLYLTQFNYEIPVKYNCVIKESWAGGGRKLKRWPTRKPLPAWPGTMAIWPDKSVYAEINYELLRNVLWPPWMAKWTQRVNTSKFFCQACHEKVSFRWALHASQDFNE